MVSNEPGRRPKKKQAVRKKKANSPIFDSEIVARIRRQINDRWPNLGRQFASFFRVSREKLDDIYSSAAQVITEHKEAFEDRLAEKKAQVRAGIRDTQQQNAPSRPGRRGGRETVKNGTAKNSARRTGSKRTRSSAKARS
jgi:hypothetical protein